MATLREVLQSYFGPLEELQRRLLATQEAVRALIVPALEFIVEHVTPERVAAWQAAGAWLEQMPVEFQDALRGTGVVMHPDFTLNDVLAILRTREYAGREAAAGFVLELHDELLRSSWHREKLEGRWQLRPRRWKVMRQALQAHDQELYAASIPLCLAQAEGLIAELVNHKGRMNFERMRQYIRELAASDDMNSGLIASFASDVLLATFEHGQLTMPAFSRHAILHGGDCSYATRANSVRSIIWYDVLLHFDRVTPSD
jgi:hypothetical protein